MICRVSPKPGALEEEEASDTENMVKPLCLSHPQACLRKRKEPELELAAIAMPAPSSFSQGDPADNVPSPSSVSAKDPPPEPGEGQPSPVKRGVDPELYFTAPSTPIRTAFSQLRPLPPPQQQPFSKDGLGEEQNDLDNEGLVSPPTSPSGSYITAEGGSWASSGTASTSPSCSPNLMAEGEALESPDLESEVTFQALSLGALGHDSFPDEDEDDGQTTPGEDEDWVSETVACRPVPLKPDQTGRSRPKSGEEDGAALDEAGHKIFKMENLPSHQAAEVFAGSKPSPLPCSLAAFAGTEFGSVSGVSPSEDESETAASPPDDEMENPENDPMISALLLPFHGSLLFEAESVEITLFPQGESAENDTLYGAEDEDSASASFLHSLSEASINEGVDESFAYQDDTSPSSDSASYNGEEDERLYSVEQYAVVADNAQKDDGSPKGDLEPERSHSGSESEMETSSDAYNTDEEGDGPPAKHEGRPQVTEELEEGESFLDGSKAEEATQEGLIGGQSQDKEVAVSVMEATKQQEGAQGSRGVTVSPGALEYQAGNEREEGSPREKGASSPSVLDGQVTVEKDIQDSSECLIACFDTDEEADAMPPLEDHPAGPIAGEWAGTVCAGVAIPLGWDPKPYPVESAQDAQGDLSSGDGEEEHAFAGDTTVVDLDDSGTVAGESSPTPVSPLGSSGAFLETTGRAVTSLDDVTDQQQISHLLQGSFGFLNEPRVGSPRLMSSELVAEAQSLRGSLKETVVEGSSGEPSPDLSEVDDFEEQDNARPCKDARGEGGHLEAERQETEEVSTPEETAEMPVSQVVISGSEEDDQHSLDDASIPGEDVTSGSFDSIPSQPDEMLLQRPGGDVVEQEKTKEMTEETRLGGTIIEDVCPKVEGVEEEEEKKSKKASTPPEPTLEPPLLTMDSIIPRPSEERSVSPLQLERPTSPDMEMSISPSPPVSQEVPPVLPSPQLPPSPPETPIRAPAAAATSWLPVEEETPSKETRTLLQDPRKPLSEGEPPFFLSLSELYWSREGSFVPRYPQGVVVLQDLHPLAVLVRMAAGVGIFGIYSTGMGQLQPSLQVFRTSTGALNFPVPQGQISSVPIDQTWAIFGLRCFGPQRHPSVYG
uniref:Uncharacterized protein n=1 Tax=Anolis carolinensis TaxID=28377 RepID=A0A803TNI4_ANOCA